MEQKDCIVKSIQALPEVEGPIPVTDASYPYCANSHSRVPIDLEKYGYLEEEFFLSGKANVYQAGENGPEIRRGGLPYKNRILVRRPKDQAHYSGRVYMDILNASAMYDIEDLWCRSAEWCVRNGHAYVGITSKPVCVQSLKNFDYDRYGCLNWGNGICGAAPVPSNLHSLPDCEDGLAWDIFSQAASLLRYGGSNNCLNGFPVEYLYFTGQSQSGMYLNTYIAHFDQLLKGPDGKDLFDGFMNIVGNGLWRSLYQDDLNSLKLIQHVNKGSRKPLICIASEGDLYMFTDPSKEAVSTLKYENRDDEYKCRYYEFAGAPHSDILCPALSSIEDVIKTNRTPPNLTPEYLEGLNDMQLAYYVCGMLEKLHIWATTGEAPECTAPIIRGNNELLRDEHGNAIGGFRTPYVDVPIASYQGSDSRFALGAAGLMQYFTQEKFEKLYNSKEDYLNRFRSAVQKDVEAGWILREEAEKMIQWAHTAVNQLRNVEVS